jgi:predicted nucleic acid-binding protein
MFVKFRIAELFDKICVSRSGVFFNRETILSLINEKDLIIIGSDILDLELSKNPNPEKKQKVQNLTKSIKEKQTLTSKIMERSKELEHLGFKPYDSLHIASAEIKKVDVFLTTDKEIIKKYIDHKQSINLNIINPIDCLEELI